MAGLAGGEAGRRSRAPGRLALVQAFVNTRDIEAGTDVIATGEGLARWVDQHGLRRGAAAVTAADVSRAAELREALRRSLEANAHLGSADVDRLARAVSGIVFRVADSPRGPVIEAAGTGVEAALGTVLAAAVTGVADGSWARLKVCRNDACRWAYWDGSRNRSGVWCSMAVCGNRAKGRTFRRRSSAAHDPVGSAR